MANNMIVVHVDSFAQDSPRARADAARAKLEAELTAELQRTEARAKELELVALRASLGKTERKPRVTWTAIRRSLADKMQHVFGPTLELHIEYHPVLDVHECFASCSRCRQQFVRPHPVGTTSGPVVLTPDLALELGEAHSRAFDSPSLVELRAKAESARRDAALTFVADWACSVMRPFVCACVRDFLAERERSSTSSSR